MVPYEPVNSSSLLTDGRFSAGELYTVDMPALMPLVSAYPAGEKNWQESFPFSVMAFDDDDEGEEDIDEEDNFDDMEDDFDDDFEDDEFDDDDDNDYDDDEDEDYDEDYDEDVDYDDFDE